MVASIPSIWYAHGIFVNTTFIATIIPAYMNFFAVSKNMPADLKISNPSGYFTYSNTRFKIRKFC